MELNKIIELTQNAIALQVPDDARNFMIQKDEDTYQVYYVYNPTHVQDSIYLCDFKRINIPPGNWQILGLSTDLTDEQAMIVVHSSQWYFPEKHTRYVDYSLPFDRENKQKWSEGFGTALESFQSLLSSKGLVDRNPHPAETEDMEDGNFFGLVDAVIHRQAEKLIKKYLILKKTDGK